MRAILKRFFVMALLTAAAVAQNTKLDGNWWRNLSEGERVQFLAGYIDCYADDFGDKNNSFPESWYTYAPRITQYYDSHPHQITRPVTSVLIDVRSKHPPKPAEGGEIWRGKHGFFNGEYWGEMRKYEQMAFIDGYLTCYRQNLSSRPKKFSKPSSVYAEHISHWFDAEPSRSPKLASKRERIAIADVLYRFADKVQAP